MFQRLFFALLFSIAVFSASAQDYKTAVGVRLSSNAAAVNHSVSIKHFINRTIVAEGLLSVKPAAIGALLEVHQPLANIAGLQWLAGGGGFFSFKNDIGVGAHGVLGLDYKVSSLPLNLSVDWKPEAYFKSNFRFEPAVVGLSVRFILPQKQGYDAAPKNK